MEIVSCFKPLNTYAWVYYDDSSLVPGKKFEFSERKFQKYKRRERFEYIIYRIPKEMENGRHVVLQEMKVKCQKCIGCRFDKSREWALRCQHEAQMHSENTYVTLTYSPEHLKSSSLNYDDFKKFMYKLRNFFAKRGKRGIKFYAAGEYGPLKMRPHWHACIFGCQFDDLVFYKRNANGDILYTSKTLDKIWGKGGCTVGMVTFKSAAYVARYNMKKVDGYQDPRIKELGLAPEIQRCSNRTAIGYTWYKKYGYSDVYAHGYAVVDGFKHPVPKYYDKKFREDCPEEWNRIRLLRQEYFKSVDPEEFSPERLRVKEVVFRAKISKLKRED